MTAILHRRGVLAAHLSLLLWPVSFTNILQNSWVEAEMFAGIQRQTPKSRSMHGFECVHSKK